MIHQVAPAPGGSGAAGGGQADRAKSVGEHAWPPGFVVDLDAALDEFVIEVEHFGADAGGGSGRMQEEDFREAHRELHFRAAALDGAGAGGEDVQRAVQQHRMQRVLGHARRARRRERHAPGRLAATRAQFADGLEFIAVLQPEIAHVAVKRAEPLGLEVRPGLAPHRVCECGLHALGAQRADDVDRPTGGLLEAALDAETALGRLVRQLDRQAGGLLGQDERLPDFEVLDGERPALEQLHSGFERHLDKRRRRKNDVTVDLVVLEVGHVAAVEAREPDRHGAWQSRVEQSLAAGGKAAVPQFGGLVPPAAFVPRIGRQREQRARWRHRAEVERHAREVKLEGGLQKSIVLAVAAGRCGHGRFAAEGAEAFLDRRRERGMRAHFEPDIDAVIGHRVDGRDEPDRLPDAASPMVRRARGAVASLAAHGAEKRDRFAARRQTGEFTPQRVGGRLHQGVVKRVVDAHEPREHALGFQLGMDGLQRGARPGERE